MDPARFHCTECGDCCRRYRVPVTAADLARLSVATGEAWSALVEWLAPDGVDMTGEPESFVVLAEGRRLPVLAFHRGACRFLGDDNRCGTYAARPACCRTFPLEFRDGMAARGSGRHAPAVSRVVLTVLPDAGCPGTFDGEPDLDGAVRRLARRHEELEHHISLVTRWNRHQRRRKMLRKPLENGGAFLRFAEAAYAGPWNTASISCPSGSSTKAP
jgi:Fe-S-cluster containining protein